MKWLRKKTKVRKPTSQEIHNYLLTLAKNGTDSQKRELYDILMSELFRSVSFADLDRSFEKLPKPRQEMFLSDAEALSQMELYKWLSEELVRLASRKIYLDSKNEFEIAVNKMVLWTERNRETLVARLIDIAKKKQMVKSMKKF